MDSKDDRFYGYSTKYALTDGIKKHEMRVVGDGMVEILGSKCSSYLHGENKDWHRTLDGAIARAEKLRIKKLQSIDRQAMKISAINFSLVE